MFAADGWLQASFSSPNLGRAWICFQTLTNTHKFSDIKQYRFIISQFWRFGVQHKSHWLKSRCQLGCVPFCRLLGAESFSFPRKLLETVCVPWTVAPSSIFKAGKSGSSPSHIIALWLCLLPPLPLLGTLFVTLGRLDNPGSPSYFKVSSWDFPGGAVIKTPCSLASLVAQ